MTTNTSTTSIKEESSSGTINAVGSIPLKIVPGRLNETILSTGLEFGGVARWGPANYEFGMRRLAGTELDGKVRDWFVEQCKNLGCTIKVDQIGNIFAIYPGKKSGTKPTATGSHLDTQPEAGKYDGILGVLAGLEVLRTFKENGYVPNFDVCVVVWFNEEGARFPRSCLGSSVWSDDLSLDEAYKICSINEDHPETVRESLTNINYLGDTPASHSENSIDAHFELHIEQGPILEDENKRIGIVTGVQAYYWAKVTVSGVGAHAGTTPWRLRKDALLMASKMICAASEICEKNEALFTTGVMDIKPYSINIIPGEVSFSLDVRHTEDDKLEEIVEQIYATFDKLVKDNKGGELTYKKDILQVSPAVKFNDICIDCVTRSANAQFKTEEVRTICSGAGHDSCQTSRHVPTSMIFIPSKDGLSHNYYEYSSPQEVEDGFKVLLQTIINYDNYRLTRGY
ncbi:uncharacterized hydrolase HI0588 [Kluyveromyces marxianus]|uniref:Uncharacterized hydrolase HI0588 n=1 Tax=Kluyveromyces marxianus (strain DMKU3-1042 / BCC 29191 / NBRC 104275) TaxID=1003335 RepID=W0T861_KLUMD|nr:uncharacterized protein KLMA_10657 [Kluyveromyces marxianus DMKU3-1042]BAO38279.1 uncharacterized hydrolase HI0588 [Kluyveromyces marxianus DMKU3-1042]BAP69843.1 uncharacterized hydrolase HI0588 [Kluyveromyces marxianus]